MSGCWLWLGALNAHGYGTIRNDLISGRLAHRYSWALANGKTIPNDTFVCHACDNPACVNPDHLFLGTQKDNMRDMHRKGRNAPSPTTKLTENQVREIRKSTDRNKDIADRYGMNPSTISNIRARRIWSHVT